MPVVHLAIIQDNPKGDIGFITDINALKYYRFVVPGEPQLSPLYEVIAKGEMPPSGPLAQAQAQIIYDWIFEGMLTDQAGSLRLGVIGVSLRQNFKAFSC
jgi:hypothetical protein